MIDRREYAKSIGKDDKTVRSWMQKIGMDSAKIMLTEHEIAQLNFVKTKRDENIPLDKIAELIAQELPCEEEEADPIISPELLQSVLDDEAYTAVESRAAFLQPMIRKSVHRALLRYIALHPEALHTASSSPDIEVQSIHAPEEVKQLPEGTP